MSGYTVDLFAGAGGWDEGLGHLGVVDPVGIDNDPHACDTAHDAGHLRLRADVSKVNPAEFADTDGLVASPPCQAWSMNGLQAGRTVIDQVLAHVHACAAGWVAPPAAICADDVRADLVLEPLRWADQLRPRWIALEQVPPVAPLWQAIAGVLDRWGYSTATTVVNAADYGVPQTRMRAILLARLDGVAHLPAPTHHDPRKSVPMFGAPWRSMADALGWPPTADLVYVNGTFEKAARRRINQPAPTIMFGERLNRVVWQTASGDPPDLDDERVTVAQAGVLQTFPEDYPWSGPRTRQYLQVGNAVPPQLAAALLSQFIESGRDVAVA